MFNKKVVFISACAGILFFGMAITTLGSVLPHLKTRFNLDDISSGALFSILPFGILAGSLLFGSFADRYGFRVLLAITCLCMSIGFLGVALSPTTPLLKICVFLFGLGGGAINGGTSALVSDISNDRDKGANLSILGVFFAIGALGMPFLLAFLEDIMQYTSILNIIGTSTLLMGVCFLATKFPAAKQQEGVSIKKSFSLLKDTFLLLISFFLFFQSAFEGLINNWTTTYLTEFLHLASSRALYILSLSVVGMTLMRLALASILRDASAGKIWSISFFFLFLGIINLFAGHSFWSSLAGLMCIGAGLAAGFPIMLSYVGERFKELSGTAFSIAFSIALIGNIMLNYTMGWLAQNYGIRNLVSMIFTISIAMAILCMIILKMSKKKS
jgi:MFS family permease